MDLSAFDGAKSAMESGLPMAVLHPATGKPTDAIISVACYDSERVLARAREIGNQKRIARQKNPKTADLVEADEDATRNLAIAAIVDWSGFEKDGKPLEFNAKNADWLLSEFKFIQSQVEQFGGDRSNFFTVGSAI
jgi:imidazolonepropionase-like amidohydrolase